MQNEYLQKLFFYSDEKLIEIVTTQREEFIPEVVAAAEHLLQNRDYEIEFDNPEFEPLDAIVMNQEMEVVLPEDFQIPIDKEETTGTIALLFAGVIFGFLGIIETLLVANGWTSEIFGAAIFLLPSIACFYFRWKTKSQADIQ